MTDLPDKPPAAAPAADGPQPPSAIWRVLASRPFRRLWVSTTVSALGSQFTLIALPWLALQLSGDPLALGVVLALGGLPRALFMLVGGVFSDRYTPHRILQFCATANMVLSGAVAVLVWTGAMQMSMLYVLALAQGLLAGFMMPASSAILPALVEPEDLQAGNALEMGSYQAIALAGPALAGFVVGRYAGSLQGIAIAFGIDALCFALSALALAGLRGGRQDAPRAGSVDGDWRGEIAAGLRHVAGQPVLRFALLMMVAMNFLFVGPMLVGVPVLAARRLPEGAQAFGWLMSGFAGGNLVGFALAGALPKASPALLRWLVPGAWSVFGLALFALGAGHSTAMDFLALLLCGAGGGYVSMVMMSWMQQSTPVHLLGRVMSIAMLAGTGLLPVSQLFAGAAARGNLSLLFGVTGACILLVALWAWLNPALKKLVLEVSTPAGVPKAAAAADAG